MKKISIITPTYNEEENIEKLCNAISIEMDKLNYEYEHIVIDNASKDNTVKILKKLASNNKKLKIILNAKNFGHIKSPIYALMQIDTDAGILMASDFQDPIDLIPKYIAEWEKGYDVVLGQKETSDEGFFKDWFKRLFYKFIKMISDDNLMLNTTGAGIFDKKIISSLKKIDDSYPYFRGLLTEITDNIKLIKFHQPIRKFGKTKNNLYTLYDIGILGIIKHSKIPLRFMTFVGFITSLFSILISLIFFIFKLLYWNSFDLGVAPLVIGLFGLASIQIFLLGFIGEYVMNILIQTRKIPLVIEKERINF